jgi:acetylornithine/N-succinyldiaminopimelate aminotransferase
LTTISPNKIMPTYYHQIPVSFNYGQGVWLWDDAGNKYLDSLSGIAVCGLGHAHPAITDVIIKQASKLLHVSNTYVISQQIELAEKLTRVAAMEQAYFCNSGAEANETAIKMARLYARKKNIANPIVISMKHSFHGRTMATISASGTERLQIGFEPLVESFMYVELNDIDALDKIIQQHQDNIVAILIEPIQGDGGIALATLPYLKHVREVCDQHDWLMMVDEVQSGMGRSGKWFAHQYANIHPDVMTVAKALGNGVPIGACLAYGKACNLFGPGKHGSTLGGNPLACAVGCAVIDTMERDQIIDQVSAKGEYFKKQLTHVMKKYPQVIEIRGKGLMIGVELDKPCMEIVSIALKHRLLFNVTFNKVIRLLPPLIITEDEMDEIVLRLDKAMDEYVGS